MRNRKRRFASKSPRGNLDALTEQYGQVLFVKINHRQDDKTIVKLKFYSKCQPSYGYSMRAFDATDA